MFPEYTISNFLPETRGNTAFHINRLEDMPPLPEGVKTPHKHRFYELFLVRAGTALHKVDFQEYELGANTFFFITQGQLHFWAKTKREDINGYRLMFTEEFFLLQQPDNRFLFELIHFDNIYQNPLLQLSAETSTWIGTYCDLLFHEFCRPDRYEKALQSLLFLLLAEVHRLYETQQTESTGRQQALVFKQFLALLETRFATSWTASNYAAALFISPRHLNRIVQSMTNQSLTNVIQNRIVLEAKRLLHFTGHSVGQIAAQLGFEDAAYFARCFRKVTGLSPTDFREQMSEKYQ
jgi:AraC family transcriptional regulator, transcriptional activator of pobA